MPGIGVSWEFIYIYYENYVNILNALFFLLHMECHKSWLNACNLTSAIYSLFPVLHVILPTSGSSKELEAAMGARPGKRCAPMGSSGFR